VAAPLAPRRPKTEPARPDSGPGAAPPAGSCLPIVRGT